MTPNNLLVIKDLSVAVAEQRVLEMFNLTIKPGEIHVLMGPNGSGKSTLANTIARNPNYKVLHGEINYLEQDLITFTPEQAALNGILLSMQYPVAIPGVTNIQFLKAAINASRSAQNLPSLDVLEFLNLVKSKLQILGIPENMLQRAINDGFSGGEKKRNEMLQMLLLQPKLAILDEIDSGVDIDALKVIANSVNLLQQSNTAVLLITHYQRLLDYVTPDFVHILIAGKLVHSGGKTLPLELEQKGYAWLKTAASI